MKTERIKYQRVSDYAHATVISADRDKVTLCFRTGGFETVSNQRLEKEFVKM